MKIAKLSISIKHLLPHVPRGMNVALALRCCSEVHEATRQVSPLQGQPGGGSGSLWVPAASFQPCSAPPEPCAPPHPCCCCIGTEFPRAAEPLRLPPWLCCRNWLWFSRRQLWHRSSPPTPGQVSALLCLPGVPVSEG